MTYWIFGGSKALGAYLTSHFAIAHNVVTFSRSEVAPKNGNHRHIVIDIVAM
jgi:hypothetical protein